MDRIALAFDPGLNLDPRDFVAAWNAIPECRAQAEAVVGSAGAAAYNLTMATFAFAVLTGVVSGVTANILTELIKPVLEQRGVTQPTELIEITQPDGTRLLIVRVAGKPS